MSQKRRQPQQKKPITKGTKIFYGSLIGFVLVFFIGLAIGLVVLNNWLTGFEAAQPTAKSQQVFQQLFEKPNWAKLYETAGEKDTAFENAASFASYMNMLVGGRDLSYVETSAGMSGDHKYIVKAGDDEVAVFTLTADNKDAQIPEWELGTLELRYARKAFCTIVTGPNCTVTVNGVTLDDSYLVKTITTKAENYLPQNVNGYQAMIYRVDQLLITPKVTVTDANGQEMELSYNADACNFSYPLGASTISAAEKNTLITAAQTYCKYMIGQVNSTTLKNYFDGSSDVYYTMTHIDKWMQSYTRYTFEEAQITDYYRYSDTLYSARVDMSLLVTRKDGTVKDYPLHSTFIMELQSGTWKVIDMLNLNIQEQDVSVRLTFMDGDNQLHSMMVASNAKSLTVPSVSTEHAVTVPDGKVFSGWYTIRVDENGKTSHDLIFQPDENGKVNLSGESELEPMVLYAYFTAKEA